ncbi:unnamed protein product [Ambrosiozyma monospora]|uniref:Unnamed protein product n=1 Tax=Ambrosiozyma monospora TaxID=43982 RepID=A0ACB5T427_AMBMO|nr:unnamed protein product [Ambrosiozyma monospora]
MTDLGSDSDFDDDPFSDDEDLDDVLTKAEQVKKIRLTQAPTKPQTQQEQEDDDDVVEVIENQHLRPRVGTTQRERLQKGSAIEKEQGQSAGNNTNAPDIDLLKGENLILRSRLDQRAKETQELRTTLTSLYESKLSAKDKLIESLKDSIAKVREDYQFLETDNRNMNNRYHQISPAHLPKKRKLHEDTSFQFDTSNTSFDENEMNTPSKVAPAHHSSSSSVPATAHQRAPVVPEFESDETSEQSPASHGNGNFQATPGQSSTTNTTTTTQIKYVYKTKVALMTQATLYQDEKNLFIEAISSHVIPGAASPTLQFLSNITSSFDYTCLDFRILANKDSFKSSIINYLIKYENRNRIDLLIHDFIKILLDFIERVFQNEDYQNDILAIPFLLSLVHFSLNYRPKAITVKLMVRCIETISSYLESYGDILRQESLYIDFNQDFSDDNNQEDSDLLMDDKTTHVKIIEVFIVVNSMCILESIVSIASYLNNFNNDYKTKVWSKLPKSLLTNCLSTRTPIEFLISIVVMLTNSIEENKRFAFNNANKKPPNGPLSIEIHSILEKLISLLNNADWNKNMALNVYGLNRTIGSNNNFKLLECLMPTTLSSLPIPKSSDTYRDISLSPKLQPKNKLKHELQIVTVQHKILQLFETYFTLNANKSIKPETLKNLVDALVYNLGIQQNLILSSPRAPSMTLRLSCIKLIVKLLHYLLSSESSDYDISISTLNSFTLREMVVHLLRISADNIKSLSADFLTKMRLTDKQVHFVHPIFHDSERFGDCLPRYGSLMKKSKNLNELVDIEVGASNGIELNYDDETIDLARDVIAQCITGDEADALHYSINYDIPVEDSLMEID